MAKNVVLKVVLLVVLVVLIAAAVFYARPAKAAGNNIPLQERAILLDQDLDPDLGSLKLITLGGDIESRFLGEDFYKLELLTAAEALRLNCDSLSPRDFYGTGTIYLLALG